MKETNFNLYSNDAMFLEDPRFFESEDPMEHYGENRNFDEDFTPTFQNDRFQIEEDLEGSSEESDTVAIEDSEYGESEEILLSSPEVEKALARKKEQAPQKESEKKKKGYHSSQMAADLVTMKYIVKFDGTPHVYDGEYGIFRPLSGEKGDELLRSIMPKKYHTSMDSNSIKELMKWLKANPHLGNVSFRDYEWRSKNVINFRNVAINIDTAEVVDATPDCYFRRFIDADYPVGNEPTGEVFNAYLDALFGDDLSARYLYQEMFGYALGDFRGLKKAFLLWGPPDTGKSVTGNLLKLLTGEEFSASMGLHDLMKDFGLIRLHGKFLNIGSEIETSTRASGSLFKRLLGNDGVPANEKFYSGIDFVNQAAMIFLGNTFPQFSLGENAKSIQERIILLPFQKVFERKDWVQNLEERLYEEASYIAKWAVDGLRRLKSNNYVFTQCLASEYLMDEFMVQAFPEYHFITTCLEVDLEGIVSSDDLDKRFKAHCHSYGVPAPVRVNWFTKLSEEFCVRRIRGLATENSKDARGYIGVSFKNI